MKTSVLEKISIYFIVAIAVVFTVFPFYWITNASFHEERTLYDIENMKWLPDL
jgi:multiple sugar transport system permease protein